ncbi:MAG: TonB-dependent receptor [Bacteroidia bacterium]
MKKHLLILGWICLFIPSLFAQEITVKDSLTRKPIADVYISNGNQAIMTSADGRADAENFSKGDSLFFQASGYATKRLNLSDIAAARFIILLRPSKSDTTMMVDMQEILVSANRRSQRLRDLPFKITSIKPEDTEVQNPQTMADVLGATGQVYIQKSQLGGGSPMIRGFAANRVVLAVDGVRMNNAIFRQGNLQNVIVLDPLSLESANVLFGPSSVMYGSDALGGVMDFKTLKPRLATADSLLFYGDGFMRHATASNEFSQHATVGLGGQKLAWVGTVSRSDFGNLRMGSHGPDEYLRNGFVITSSNGFNPGGSIDTILSNSDPRVQANSGYTQFNTMQKLRFHPSDNWDMQYAFHYSRSSDVPRYDRLIQSRNGSLRYGEWYYGPQTWMMHHLHIDRRNPLGIFGKAQFNIAYQRFGESRFDRNFGSTTLRARTERVDALSANLDFDKELGTDGKWLLQYGAEALYNKVGSQGEARPVTGTSGSTETIASRYPDGAEWTSYAAYSQLRFIPNKNLTLTGGIRYNQVAIDLVFDTSFYDFSLETVEGPISANGALSGSVGMAWRFADALQLNSNIAAGFRAPNVDDIAKVFDSEPGNVVVPNVDLGPEYAYNFEIGLLKTMDQQGKLKGTGLWERLQFGVTGFYTLLQNAMVRRPFSLNGRDSIVYDGVLSQVEALVNTDQAWIAGVQLDGKIRLSKTLNASTNFTWLTGEAQDGEPLRHVVPAYGRTQLDWKKGKVRLAAYAVYNLEMPFESLASTEKDKPHLYAVDENGDPFSPGWATLNLSGAWQFHSQASLQLSLENITDLRYRPYSSGIAGPGLNGVVSVKVRW